ncbi:MAG: glycoside hydrolase, partial [Candidatus Glassbacteria bacterium]|nr:glycoside hydrolase [Candidatus Glassbacteria bacterium]
MLASIIRIGRPAGCLAAAILLCLALPGCSGQEKLRIYIANDDHTDYLWSAGQDTYRQAFLEMIDYYLDLADSTESLPSCQQSRWNCDGSLWLWTYERNRSKQQFERLIGRIRDGHVNVPLNPLVQALGGAPAEAVLRGMYYAGTVERRYGLRFKLAAAIENQTLPYGLGSLFAGSGARYTWHGICNCATRVPDAGNREHEIYWWLGPDSSRVLAKWYSMPVSNQHLGGYAEAFDPEAVVEYVSTQSDTNGFRARYPYRVIGAFGKGWDELQTMTDEFVEVARSKSSPSRRVIVSNEVDFFEDFEKTYGRDLPEQAVSFGNEWDLLCASLAEVSARVKRSVEKLRSAEALAVLVSLQDPSFMEGRRLEREQAWMDLGLYWEHDWTADGPVPREVRRDWQRTLARQVE